MWTQFASFLKHGYRKLSLDYQYASRVARAIAVRVLLRLCLGLFVLERLVSPICKRDGKRILVIVIGGMGDCLLFDPLFRRIKEQWPHARIDVLTGSFEQMWARVGSVDRVIFFKPAKFKPPWAYAHLFRTIHRNAYDIVAEGIAMVPKRGIFPLFTSLVMQASGAAVRIGRPNTGRLASLRPRRLDFIGHAEMAARKKHPLRIGTNPYVTHIISPPPPHQRDVHESAYIFEPLGLRYFRRPHEPILAKDPSIDSWAHTLLRNQWATADDVIVAMTLETTRQIKAWPLDRFEAIVKKGISDGYKFVLVGLDRDLAEALACGFPAEHVMNLSGRTTLSEMIALIGCSDVFFACDCGPAHIAQACRVPTVVLFGPSNEREFGPVDLKLHTLVVPPEAPSCRPCVLGPCIIGRSCVPLIDPTTAYQCLSQTISRPAHRQSGRPRTGRWPRPTTPSRP